MKRYEFESLLKNFLLFFTLLELLLATIFYQNYKEAVHSLKNQIFNRMYNCSWTLQCPEFHYDIVQRKKMLFQLQKQKDYYAIFPIAGSKKYSLKITYPANDFEMQAQKIERKILLQFVLYSFLLALIALFISFYSLHPIKKALHINEEFIKDILHDINTPLSSIIFNLALLQNSAHSKQIERINRAVKTIITLQENLKTFLKNAQIKKIEPIQLNSIIKESIENTKTLHPDVEITLKEEATLIFRADAKLLQRVFDNLLDNAAKYNSKKSKKIVITIENKRVTIADNGDGIENPKRVFDRYYKERERGIGIGLHIVKKICDELGIEIAVKSQKNRGTRFILTVTDT